MGNTLDNNLVSRQAVLDLIEHYNSDGLGSVFYGYEQGVKFADAVNKLPPVTPAEKVGRWINARVGKIFPSNDYKCSECGNILNFDGVNCGRGDANYCPNCGAKMQEGKE